MKLCSPIHDSLSASFMEACDDSFSRAVAIFLLVRQQLERTASTYWSVPGKYGPHGELFFFLLKKGPMVLRELVDFGPCVPAENSESMCLHWCAHDGGRECLSVEQ